MTSTPSDASAAAELSRCEKFRDEAFSSNPAVRFMFKHLKRGGCELDRAKVECRRCDGQLAGGFQDDGGILLCSNHLTTQAHASNTLIHEAVHAFDACRANVDWGNCVHHACSEIRAATLSGDCNFTREVLLRRNFGFAKQFQRCVKRRAELSVSLNPYCDQHERIHKTSSTPLLPLPPAQPHPQHPYRVLTRSIPVSAQIPFHPTTDKACRPRGVGLLF